MNVHYARCNVVWNAFYFFFYRVRWKNSFDLQLVIVANTLNDTIMKKKKNKFDKMF